jgi:hypothetical protein
MKKAFVFLALLVSAGFAHADCQAVANSQMGQICAMLTDAQTCNMMQGQCQWVGTTGSGNGQACSGSSPVCAQLPDQSTCSEIPGCNWN